jgi:hypothetical protein
MEANRSKLQFLIKQDKQKKFLQFSVIKTPDPDSLEMLDPDKYPDPDSLIPDKQICMIFENCNTKLLKIDAF